MDHAYAVEKLTEFVGDINALLEEIDRSGPYQWPEASDELELQEVRARLIENAYVPTLGDYEPPGNPREN
ncbi:hypothetical protein [Embleya sp. NBC_00896]|uniref:hypothetical protein n=1 Tax=Embleya sp. NBC_00896 TaxID=2975961 RepID=UPI003863C714|nr:hypothetical protein OG928_46630 [Embleya sp. NBC_00896]